MTNHWADRLNRVYKKSGMSKAELARRAGLNYDIVIKYLDGQVHKPRRDNIAKLARALKVDPLWLEKGIDLLGVPVAGHVRAGAFHEVDQFDQSAVMRIPITPDPRYAGARQYAWLVNGDSMDKAGILPGMYVLGVDYHDYIERWGPVAPGDFVIVERTRFGGHERELTVKRYWSDGETVELHPMSTNPRWQPIVMEPDAIEVDPAGAPVSVEIKAIVVSVHSIFKRHEVEPDSVF